MEIDEKLGRTDEGVREEETWNICELKFLRLGLVVVTWNKYHVGIIGREAVGAFLNWEHEIIVIHFECYIL